MSRILALSANPDDTTRLRLNEEVREIRARLRAANADLQLEAEGAVRGADLQHLLLRHAPHIVHFSGHGTAEGEVVLEDFGGESRPIPVDVLRETFRTLGDNVKCVVLNSCYSSVQAEAIARHIDCVIGMSSEIGDKAAIAFAASFYQALAFGRSVQSAFDLGRLEVALVGVPGDKIPKLHARKGVNASKIVLASHPELVASFVLDGDRAPVCEDEHYQIRLWIRNAPADTTSVVYQFNDE
jgi:hypothetical protein